MTQQIIAERYALYERLGAGGLGMKGWVYVN